MANQIKMWKEANQRQAQIIFRLEEELKLLKAKLCSKDHVEQANLNAYVELSKSMAAMGENMARLVMYATGQRFGGGGK